MVLTAENYYSQEANEEYMSVSQFKDFCGTYGKMPCEFTAMEKLKGRWEEPKSKALMVGSYVDSYFEGTLDKFKAENPDLFKRDGTLKAEFVKADEIIQRIERDDYFMKFMSGKKQVIMTGELFGTKWKIKMDSYIPDIAIVDLKVMASITKLEWVRDIVKGGVACINIGCGCVNRNIPPVVTHLLRMSEETVVNEMMSLTDLAHMYQAKIGIELFAINFYAGSFEKRDKGKNVAVELDPTDLTKEQMNIVRIQLKMHQDLQKNF